MPAFYKAERTEAVGTQGQGRVPGLWGQSVADLCRPCFSIVMGVARSFKEQGVRASQYIGFPRCAKGRGTPYLKRSFRPGGLRSGILALPPERPESPRRHSWNLPVGENVLSYL